MTPDHDYQPPAPSIVEPGMDPHECGECGKRHSYAVEVTIRLEEFGSAFGGDEQAAYAFVDALLQRAHDEAIVRAVRNQQTHPGWDFEMAEGCVTDTTEEDQ